MKVRAEHVTNDYLEGLCEKMKELGLEIGPKDRLDITRNGANLLSDLGAFEYTVSGYRFCASRSNGEVEFYLIRRTGKENKQEALDNLLQKYDAAWRQEHNIPEPIIPTYWKFD